VPALRPGGLALEHQEIVPAFRAHLRRAAAWRCEPGSASWNVLRKGGRITGVRTASGDEVRANLTLSADGRHSRLRKMLGIRARQRAISLSAIALAGK
jgi:2-polyprenyl-6-methoxyphenol hydroxylase-like FAD-dependent oxidoreductase